MNRARPMAARLIKILKEFLEIQDGDQTEVLRGKFKI